MIRAAGLALWLALLGLALACIALAQHQAPSSAALTNADYRRCVTVQPPPLAPHRKIVLYPRNSELS